MFPRLTSEHPSRATGASGHKGDLASCSDGVLLDRFVRDRDEASFEALVRRHGPVVLATCRRWLGEDEAEDAFQATFLALVGQAGKLRKADRLGAWLGCVARRIARRARKRANLRRGREGAGVDVSEIAVCDDTQDDFQPILRAEVAGLPDKYRRALELYYWHGLSCEQAARQLDCPVGTVKWRLSRGREMLRGRLKKVGVALLFLFAWLRLGPASSAIASARGSSPGRGRRSRSGGGVLSEGLSRRTITLALAIRDRPGIVPGAPDPGVARTPGKRRRWLVHLGGSLLILVVVLGLIAGFTPARWQAQAALVDTSSPPQRSACH